MGRDRPVDVAGGAGRVLAVVGRAVHLDQAEFHRISSPCYPALEPRPQPSGNLPAAATAAPPLQRMRHNRRDGPMSEHVLTTAVVGSYPQPDWLVDRDNLAKRLPPRVRAHEMWRIPPAHLEEAQEAATLAAIRDQERAGIDVISDGEIRRESYSNRLATALGGIDRTAQRHGASTGPASRRRCRWSQARSAASARSRWKT